MLKVSKGLKEVVIMKEIIQTIIEKSQFPQADKLEAYLSKCMHVSKDTPKSTYAPEDNVLFKTEVFLKGFKPFENSLGKGHSYAAAAKLLQITLDEIGIDIEPEECFILYHLRDLGKFRLREDKLYDELKPLWVHYHQFKIEKEDFTYTLKQLMRAKFIDYRRGNLWLKPSLLIRYR